MNKYSVTWVGLAVVVLGKLAELAGWDANTFTEMQVEGLVNSVGFVMQVVGGIVAVYGRYRQGDIDILGRKQRPNIVIDSLP